MASSQSLHAGSSTMNRLNEKQARLEQRLAQIQLISGELPKLIHPGRIKEGDTAYWGSGGLQLPSWSQTRGDASFACVSWSASLTSRPRQLISPDAGAPPIAGLPCGQPGPSGGGADPPAPKKPEPTKPWPTDEMFREAAEEVKKAIEAQHKASLVLPPKPRFVYIDMPASVSEPERRPSRSWAASEMPASMSGPRQRRKPLHHDEDHLPMHAHAPLAESYTPGAMSKSLSASEPYVPLLPEKFATPPDHAAPLLDRYADDIKHPERSKPLEHADEPWPQPNEFKSFAMPFLPEMPTKWPDLPYDDSSRPEAVYDAVPPSPDRELAHFRFPTFDSSAALDRPSTFSDFGFTPLVTTTASHEEPTPAYAHDQPQQHYSEHHQLTWSPYRGI